MATTEDLEDALIQMERDLRATGALWDFVEAVLGEPVTSWTQPKASFSETVQLYWGSGYTVLIEPERARRLVDALIEIKELRPVV